MELQPHLDSTDLRSVKVPRLAVDVESVIADLMDRSVSISAKADRLENEVTKLTQEQVDITIGEIVSDAQEAHCMLGISCHQYISQH